MILFVCFQGVFSFWEEAEKELKLKKMRVMELHHVLSKFEADRTNKVRRGLFTRMFSCQLTRVFT